MSDDQWTQKAISSSNRRSPILLRCQLPPSDLQISVVLCSVFLKCTRRYMFDGQTASLNSQGPHNKLNAHKDSCKKHFQWEEPNNLRLCTNLFLPMFHCELKFFVNNYQTLTEFLRVVDSDVRKPKLLCRRMSVRNTYKIILVPNQTLVKPTQLDIRFDCHGTAFFRLQLNI